ncbi:hypothetical protein SDC9_146468 [bioreactor metagenome]|uniref:Uncharacterized protein n=1 Tax=bioreactor metagenome TaxID=1076179 RepID=A0A645EBC0_9ZZZZ
MNNITSPDFDISSITALSLSSNSPLYFEPATIEDRSKVTTLLSLNNSGILPDAIFCASPSAIAVLPTPGSPIKQGLFLILLQSISRTLWVSFSRPITGSNFPSLARAVKSLPYFSSVGVLALLDFSLEAG